MFSPSWRFLCPSQSCTSFSGSNPSWRPASFLCWSGVTCPPCLHHSSRLGLHIPLCFHRGISSALKPLFPHPPTPIPTPLKKLSVLEPARFLLSINFPILTPPQQNNSFHLNSKVQAHRFNLFHIIRVFVCLFWGFLFCFAFFFFCCHTMRHMRS